MPSLTIPPLDLPEDFVGVSGVGERRDDPLWQQDVNLSKFKGHPWSTRSERDAFETNHLWGTPGLQEMTHVEGRFLPLRLASGGWQIPDEIVLQGLADRWRFCGMRHLLDCEVAGCQTCRTQFPIGGMTHYQVQCARSWRLSDGGPKAPSVIANFKDDPLRPGWYAIISCVQCNIDGKQDECTVKGFSFGPAADLDEVAFFDRPGIKREASAAELELGPAGRSESHDDPAGRDPSPSPLQELQPDNGFWMIAMGRGDRQMEIFSDLAKDFIDHLD